MNDERDDTRRTPRRRQLQQQQQRLQVDYKLMRFAATGGLSLLVGSLYFWGSLSLEYLMAPPGEGAEAATATTTQQQLHQEVRDVCLWSGTFATTILIGHFFAVYYNSIKKELPMTFVVYWFAASLFFDLVWEIPLWSTNLIAAGDSVTFLDRAHLPWAIAWWSYSVSDEWYVVVTPTVIVFEIWYLLGNLFGVAGLWYYCFHRQHQHQANKALVLFLVCGCLQCYNATVYLFLGWYVDNWEAAATDDIRGIYIYAGLNGFWGLASAVAAYHSWQELLLFLAAADNNDKDGDGKID